MPDNSDNQNQLFTIGYEGAHPLEVVQALHQAGVHTLVDVRAVALSRRPGFSKTALSTFLAAHGISYVHLRDLGTPKSGRDAARAGRVAEMHTIFHRHMHTPEAQTQLAEAVDLAKRLPACLLCYEHNHQGCHRLIVAEAIQAHAPLACVHLRPIPLLSEPAVTVDHR